MSDHPFHEPSDDDRTTFVRPVPGGRATPARDPSAPLPAPEAVAAPASAGEPVGALFTGQTPLIAAATPLLQLLGRLRNTYNPPDPGELRARTIQAVRDFETAARAAAIPYEVLHPARYALCASVDDVVLHTSWGEASLWFQASLVSTFHQEVVSGENFFHQLTALKREPARNLALLELMYLCLSLGYRGQYNLSRHGPAQLDNIREDLYQTIVRLRGSYDQALSPRWEGMMARYKPARAAVPVWVMGLSVVGALGLCWWMLAGRLDTGSELSRAAAGATPPSGLPVINHPVRPVDTPVPPDTSLPPPPPSSFAQEIRRLAQTEGQQIVNVSEDPQTVRVQIFSKGMFATGRAEVLPVFVPLLERIGEALNKEPGDVVVTGHTDNQPIVNRIPFASNLALSKARAESARAIILRHLKEPNRLTVEGHADERPIQPNDSDEHRAQNRRIEVLLQRGG